MAALAAERGEQGRPGRRGLRRRPAAAPAKEQSRVAVLSAGYADGLLRVLSNKGRVIVRGHFAPIIGTVSMDLTAADVTGIPSVRVGDIATIYGTDGGTTQSVPDVARIANTASADLLCALGKRVPRFYLP